MQEQIFNDLVAFIYIRTGYANIPITPGTSMENYIGITGDDGEEFIVQFSKRYGVDISNFYFEKYFYPEPALPVMPKEIRILTVGHLVKAIQEKRLDDNIING